MPDHEYEAGRRDGQIEALREVIADLKDTLVSIERRHATRLDSHEKRFTQIERILWGVIGVIAFIGVVPELKDFFGG